MLFKIKCWTMLLALSRLVKYFILFCVGRRKKFEIWLLFWSKFLQTNIFTQNTVRLQFFSNRNFWIPKSIGNLPSDYFYHCYWWIILVPGPSRITKNWKRKKKYGRIFWENRSKQCGDSLIAGPKIYIFGWKLALLFSKLVQNEAGVGTYITIVNNHLHNYF